ncbi:uncharacterized protein LOC110984757 isoform X2 [Acanthaster planci]|uniref:Uncharacterized protein LOC110984757 isoform X2 n=1 Tax=Acanthaster planci TaxID=133434 RepID=A0A8B7ZCK9_ACAPL|nr:uncharacterized protein LOC110984757 isoform X2 [Acanthaster planci]
MPRRKQQAPKRLKAHEGDVETDDVSPGELADDESDDVEEKEKEAEREDGEVGPKEVKREQMDEETQKPSTSGCLTPDATSLKSPTRCQASPTQPLSANSISFSSVNGPMTMLSKMCTALSGTDSDSEDEDSDLETVLRFSQLGMRPSQSIPEQEEALDLRVSKVKRRKDQAPHQDRSSSKSKRSSDSSGGLSPSKGIKTVFCETVPRDVLASVSRLQTDYSVLPTQVSLCRGINGRCNFVLCTDCYQAFPNVGMLSLHLIATGHNSTKQLNSELMLQRGYLALVPPRTEFFSTCALRRKQRLPAASSRKELCAYTCSTCSVSFPDFLDYTVHLTTSGHDKHEKPHVPQSKPPAGDCPEEIPVNQVLKCMICQASFRTLKDLTMHMVRTKHYSHVPGHAGILLTRSNAKPNEKEMDEAEEEDGNILGEEDTQDAANPVMESLPATVFPKETDNLSRREKRNSESSTSSREEVCQNTTKAALNQMLAARSQRVPASVGRSRSVDAEASQKTSKSRSLKCLGCSHLFANVHKLTDHMKETGHFLAPAFGHDVSGVDRIVEPDASTNGLSMTMKSNSAARKLWPERGEDDHQQPGDKIKIILKDGASKQQLLNVSSVNADSKSKETALRSNRADSREDDNTEDKAQKKLLKASPAESKEDEVKGESPKLAIASELLHSQKSPSPHPSPPSTSVRYVNPDNFDELFPTNLTRPKSSAMDNNTNNPLDKLTSMVEAARDTNFHPRLLGHRHRHHPNLHNSPWMPLVETPQQQFVNGSGVFPSYAGLAMVYNALSQATNPSEAIASKMEKHLAAKESENVTVAEAIDKILSHSFRKEEKHSDPLHGPKLGTSCREMRHGQSSGLKLNAHSTCPSSRTRVHARRSSRHMRTERLKRVTDAKESVVEHQIHRKTHKRRRSLPADMIKTSVTKGIVSQPKCSGKNILSLKPYRADIQRVDQTRPTDSNSLSHASSSGSKKEVVRATTVSVPVQKSFPKKGLVSVFMKKSGGSLASQRQEHNGTNAPTKSGNSRDSPRKHEHENRQSAASSLGERLARLGTGMQNHEPGSQLPPPDPKPAKSSSLCTKNVQEPLTRSAYSAELRDKTEESSCAKDELSVENRKTATSGRTEPTSHARSSGENPNCYPCVLPSSIEIKKERPDNTSSESGELYGCQRKTQDSRQSPPVVQMMQNHLSPNDKSPDNVFSREGGQASSHSVEHNGVMPYDPNGDTESVNREGHISRLKRSLEMYKMFCGSSSSVHEMRPTLKSDSSRNAMHSPSKVISQSACQASTSGAPRIKQEPGAEVAASDQEGRPLKCHGLPVKRTHNNNSLPHSSESNNGDVRSASRNRASPDSPANCVPDNRKSAEFAIGSSSLVQFSESAIYPNSDPLQEIDKLVNSTTGIQPPPVPPKIARISVDLINRGTYMMKREPEVYVNPGSENIKTNPLEEMCKMLNATHR